MYFLITITIFLLSSCVVTEDYTLLRNDVNELMRESIRQKRDISNAKSQLFSSERQDADSDRQKMLNALRESQADLNTRFSQSRKELQSIHNRLDENSYYMEKTFKEDQLDREILNAKINTLEKQTNGIIHRIDQLESGITQKKITKPEQTQPSSGDTEAKEELKLKQKVETEAPRTMYDNAYETFQSQQYAEARNKFTEFSKRYPDDSLTGNAYFWIAETYYKEENYEDAIIAYETMLKKYPESEKIPAALLKQAYSFFELPDKKTSKVILESLIERFPDSKEASLAKKRLETMR